MRIIAKRALRNFWQRHRDAEQPLKAWYRHVSVADWAGPADVKVDYRSASLLRGNRVCFNVAGNKYRLVVRINYPYRVVYVRFLGSRAEYDRIDADRI